MTVITETPAKTPAKKPRRRWPVLVGFTLLAAVALTIYTLQLEHSDLMELGQRSLQFVGYVAQGLILLFVYRFIANHFTRGLDDDLEIEDLNNIAYAIFRGFQYLGFLIGVTGITLGTNEGLVGNQIRFFKEGLIVMGIFLISRLLTDPYVLRRVKNLPAMLGDNKQVAMAVAIVEGAIALYIGLLLNGAFAGEGGGIANALLLAAAAQLAGMLLYFFYGWWVNFCLDDEVKKGNIACAIEVAAFLVPMGILQRFSIIGPSEGLWTDLATYATSLALGVPIFLIVMAIVDWRWLRHTDLRAQEHHGKEAPSIIVFTILTGIALLIGTVF